MTQINQPYEQTISVLIQKQPILSDYYIFILT